MPCRLQISIADWIKMKIAVIDYKMSNMFSIKNALDFLGFDCRVTSDPKVILDADGADIILKDGGTSFAELDKDNNNFRIKNPIADGDIKIQGVDGSSTITALDFDMSNAGAATFNSFIYLDYIRGKNDNNTGINVAGSDVLELQTGGFYTFKKLLERCGEEDADGTGVLKPEFMKEMLQILAKIYRLDVSSSGYDRLFVGFSDKYGMVKYKSLVQAVRGFLNEPRMEVVKQAFDKFEKDKWGRVMMKTIEDRYDVTEHPKVVSGEMTKTEAEFEFYSKFDKRSDQPVAFDEFVDVYEWISANCNEDEAFKSMVRSPWHLKSDDVEVGCRRVLVWHTNGSQDIVTLGNDIPALATKELMIEKLKQDYGILDICDVTAI